MTGGEAKKTKRKTKSTRPLKKMGAVINVTNVTVLNNPAPFTSKLAFEISFECLDNLTDDLEWKVVYVGSSEDEALDQVNPIKKYFFSFFFPSIDIVHLVENLVEKKK